MRRLKRHPGFERLCDYVDAGEESPDWRGIRSHLRSCTRCRDEVAWLRRLREEATRLGPVTPPPGLLEKVLARRAAGERIILQTHGPVEMDEADRELRRGGNRWPVAALVGLVSVGAASALWVSTADAGSNTLTFEPQRPGPGEVVQIRYVPTTMLAGADSLRLRAQFRAAGQARGDAEFPGDRLSLTLHADEAGVFHGTLKMPPVAAYGQVAVEDTQGSAVDSNNQRLWELMTYDGKKPTYEALRQRLIAAEGVDWRRMQETSEQIVQLYPERPEGWYQRLAVEMQFGDPVKMDSVVAHHRRVLEKLQAASASRDLSADDMGVLVEYATALGDGPASLFWAQSLERFFPDHPVLLRSRARSMLSDDTDSGAFLEAVERLWMESRPDVSVAQAMFDVAVESGRLAQAEAWAERVVKFDPRWHVYVGGILSELDESRVAGIRHLYEAERHVSTPDGNLRPLRLSIEDWMRERADRRQAIAARLIGALLAEGETEPAAVVLAEALGRALPRPGLAGEFASHALAAGDTARAVAFLVRAAADPVADSFAIAERGLRLARHEGMSQADWDRAVGEARAALAEKTVQAAVYQPLKSELTVRTADGEMVPVRTVGARRRTLVVATVLAAHTAEANIRQFRDLHAEVDRLDLHFAALVLPTGDLRFEDVAEQAEGVDIYLDEGNVAATALGVWSLREYLVFDADGVCRGSFHDIDDALRLLRFLPPAPLAA